MNISIIKLKESFTEFEKLVNSTSVKMGDIIIVLDEYYTNVFVIGLSDDGEYILINIGEGDILTSNFDSTDIIKELIETYQVNEFTLPKLKLSID